MFFRLAEMVRLALNSLGIHKMRSALTGLGIIFGVGAVISMVSIGEGLRADALERIKLLGVDTIIVRSIKPPEKEQASTQEESFAMTYGLTFADADRMEQVVPTVGHLIPLRDLRKEVWYGARRVKARVFGTTPAYATATRFSLERGRFIADLDESSYARVCVIGAAVRRDLFPFDNPLGRRLKIGNDSYEIIGAMAEHGEAEAKGSLLMGRDMNQDIYVPLAAALQRFGTVSFRQTSGTVEAVRLDLDEILIKVTSEDVVEETGQIIQSMLSTSHREPDYQIVVPKELLRERQRTQTIFSIVMGSIAGISLLVGGIGIMNIMLATVTERTREIGIRRAIGATRADIVVQFLIETVVLSSLGGLVGILVGIAGARIVSAAVAWRTIVTGWSLVVAVGISGFVGIVFGLYPAYKAAKLDPIRALRYE